MSAPAPGNGWWSPDGAFSDNVGNTLQQNLQIINGALSTYAPNSAQEVGGTQSAILQMMQLVLSELRVITYVLQSGLNVADDPAELRNEFMSVGHYPSD